MLQVLNTSEFVNLITEKKRSKKFESCIFCNFPYLDKDYQKSFQKNTHFFACILGTIGERRHLGKGNEGPESRICGFSTGDLQIYVFSTAFRQF